MTDQSVSSSTIFDLKVPAMPAASASGRFVAFEVVGSDEETDANTSTIWYTDLTTGSVDRLCAGLHDHHPSWSPNPSSRVGFGTRSGPESATDVSPVASFARVENGEGQVWTCPIDGEPAPLTNVSGSVLRHAWSPCGRYVAVTFVDVTVPISVAESPTPWVLGAYGYQRDGRARFG